MIHETESANKNNTKNSNFKNAIQQQLEYKCKINQEFCKKKTLEIKEISHQIQN